MYIHNNYCDYVLHAFFIDIGATAMYRRDVLLAWKGMVGVMPRQKNKVTHDDALQ